MLLTGSLTDYVRSLCGREDISVDHEVVVRGRFAVNAVEAFEVVAATRVGVFDHAHRLRIVNRVLRADAFGSSRR